MPLSRDVILRAFRKTTRETNEIVRERVLPWNKGGGREKGKMCAHRYRPKKVVKKSPTT